MSDTVGSLAEFVAALKAAELVPLPQQEEWKEHVERISVPGRVAEITEDNFEYWLEVLPPKFMRGSHFCFAEGAEAFRFFWQDKGRYFVRQLTWEETVTFCRLAGIELPW